MLIPAHDSTLKKSFERSQSSKTVSRHSKIVSNKWVVMVRIDIITAEVVTQEIDMILIITIICLQITLGILSSEF